MKIIGFSIAVGLITLLSFQNCQKAPYQDEINLAKNGTTSGNSSLKVNLAEQRVSEVQFLSEENQSITKNGRTFTIVVNSTSFVDLATGKIKVVSDLDGGSQNYCLTEDLKNELLNIVKSSSVCKLGNQIPSGSACTQALKLPYARIVTTNEQFDLGGASDGCGSNAVDLCEQQPDLLKGFAANLRAKLATLGCQ